jgi:DNA-binding beta-propeller fold protein YncE
VGIALDTEGKIYSSNFNNTTIKKTTPVGVTSNLVTNNLLTGGGGLAFDNDGNLFNTFFSSATLYKITNGVVTEFTTSNLFNGPVGLTYDKVRGELYVASFNSGKILNVAVDGTVTEVADTPATIGHLAYANDHFYVTGWNEHKVYKVSLTGAIVETIGRGTNADLDGPAASAQFSQPNGIAVSPDGRYVFVSQGNGKLRKIIMARDN